LRTFNKAA